LRNRTSQQALKADFEAYLDGFSPNVREILEKETEGLLGEIIGGK